MAKESYTERIERLRDKANRLPMSPGVYLMKDSQGKVIYVGKSKSLKNRVTSYFTDLDGHTVKTARLVDNIADFDMMLTTSEIEALALENRLIKLYTPKFNIKLKDSKTYPYIKVTINEPYPRVTITRKRLTDGARYFGPYSGTQTAYSILHTVRKVFGIPDCKKKFPKDIGTRPCLNAQIGLCRGICTGNVSAEDYRTMLPDLLTLLSGSFSAVRASLTEQMNFAAENLRFEAAARIRDRINALTKLWDKQKVVAAPGVEQDVIALYTEEGASCLSVFFIRDGAICDRENVVAGADRLFDEDATVSALYELYRLRTDIPKEILIDFDLSEENLSSLQAMLEEQSGHRISLRRPERGSLKQLCRLVWQNAKEYCSQFKDRADRQNDTLIRLASLLQLEVVPERIECFDISEIGSEHITAGKILVENGKLEKSGYRTYTIKGLSAPDDYYSMRQAVERRLGHPEDPFPDLLLLDGGRAHVSVIRSLLHELQIDIPVYGMVKDDFHKTRALTDEQNEISIAKEQAVYQLIYQMQEEVHRYTVSRMSGAKRKTLKTSSLTTIPGIGPAKAKLLLSAFGGLTPIKSASLSSLAAVKGITETDARRLFDHFHPHDDTTQAK